MGLVLQQHHRENHPPRPCCSARPLRAPAAAPARARAGQRVPRPFCLWLCCCFLLCVWRGGGARVARSCARRVVGVGGDSSMGLSHAFVFFFLVLHAHTRARAQTPTGQTPPQENMRQGSGAGERAPAAAPPPPLADSSARAPLPPPPRNEDVRHLAAPMSELAAVQLEVASVESKCRK